jgi:IS4 transposase
VRLVWVKTRENNVLILATNLPPEKLSAALVWLVYKSRWKVELFFRWIKCILGCRHWLAESANGCAIQLYLALIAALLLQLHFGRRPNKRMMELIEFHQLGIATDHELQVGLERQLQRMEQRKKV